MAHSTSDLWSSVFYRGSLHLFPFSPRKSARTTSVVIEPLTSLGSFIWDKPLRGYSVRTTELLSLTQSADWVAQWFILCKRTHPSLDRLFFEELQELIRALLESTPTRLLCSYVRFPFSSAIVFTNRPQVSNSHLPFTPGERAPTS